MISKEEKKLFSEAMKNVTPLKAGSRNRKKDPVRKLRIPRRIEKPPPLEAVHILDDLIESEWVKIDEILRFNRAGLQTKILKKLAKGQLPVEARADLHRMSVTEAINFADQFIQGCQMQKIRHILIIHGKGKKSEKPILKNAIYVWLKNNHAILAFHSADPKDGGTGALYVLIKLSTEKQV